MKIERTAARGFEPVADEPSFHAGRHERSRGRFDRESPSRHTRNVKIEKIDPWFLKPYEEGSAPAAATPPKADDSPTTATSGAKKAGVGALLGGLAKKA